MYVCVAYALQISQGLPTPCTYARTSGTCGAFLFLFPYRVYCIVHYCIASHRILMPPTSLPLTSYVLHLRIRILHSLSFRIRNDLSSKKSYFYIYYCFCFHINVLAFTSQGICNSK
ncbi:hypothetical protein F5Y00DRAFT_148507 [Daldinia vernicosa]|uniref:uncharacterized protein n=1 Tax=Daldinia vernicosa TaxID=114800 RepID=UPI0020074CE7|nr:uncharacterized protein F5Y00DRAFT_148507 [Daldinia vernicosa]KAI0846259.1 hypothetical protein F5Y00DRAFT_148507 [Daldinia vernicosa]